MCGNNRTRFKVSGILQALVTQTCAVSLEPFETLVSAPVDVDFAPSRQPLGEPANRKMTAGGGAAKFAGPRDAPDPIIGGQIALLPVFEENDPSASRRHGRA